MALIFLNRFFHPDHSATSQLLSDLAFAMARRGRAVHVVTSRQLYDKPGARLPKHEIIDGVTVHRVRSSHFGRSNLFGRAIDYLTFYFSASWRLWRLARNADVVIAKTDPPLISVPAAVVVRFRRARLVNWLQDVFPEVAEAANLGGPIGKPLFYLLHRLRNHSLRTASFNIALGERMAEHLQALGISRKQIHVIANWQDGRLVRPVAHNENPLREEWGLTDKFVVSYSGNLGRVHDLTTILDAMALLQSWREDKKHKKHKKYEEHGGSSDPEIACLFIGGGALHRRLGNEISRRQLENIEIHAYQPRDQLAQSLSVADVHLVSLRPEFEGLIVPSKFYGIAAAGRATLFIGDERGEIPRLLDQHHCGFTVSQGDGEALAKQILELSRNQPLCREMGLRARTLFEERFESNTAIEAWAGLLDKLNPAPKHTANEQFKITASAPSPKD